MYSKLVFLALFILLVCATLSQNVQATPNCWTLLKTSPALWEEQANTYLQMVHGDFIDLLTEVDDEELLKETSRIVAGLCQHHGVNNESLAQVIDRAVNTITPRAQAFLDYGPELLNEHGM